VGPLGIAATNRPIVPAPGDYDDGKICGMIGRGNRSTRRKPASVPLCPHKPYMLPGLEARPTRWELTLLLMKLFDFIFNTVFCD
jgi:hypothetical protein